MKQKIFIKKEELLEDTWRIGAINDFGIIELPNKKKFYRRFCT